MYKNRAPILLKILSSSSKFKVEKRIFALTKDTCQATEPNRKAAKQFGAGGKIIE